MWSRLLTIVLGVLVVGLLTQAWSQDHREHAVTAAQIVDTGDLWAARPWCWEVETGGSLGLAGQPVQLDGLRVQ